jgi:hypothetical protein
VPMKKNGHVKTELRAVRHFLTLFFFKSWSSRFDKIPIIAPKHRPDRVWASVW